jgi:hypothetical protein
MACTPLLDWICVEQLQDRLLGCGLMEGARASWWHATFLQMGGSKIGRGVFFDTMAFQACAPAPLLCSPLLKQVLRTSPGREMPEHMPAVLLMMKQLLLRSTLIKLTLHALGLLTCWRCCLPAELQLLRVGP